MSGDEEEETENVAARAEENAESAKTLITHAPFGRFDMTEEDLLHFEQTGVLHVGLDSTWRKLEYPFE